MTVETTNPVVWEITDCERCSQLVMDWEGSREIDETTGVFSVVGTCWNPSVEVTRHPGWRFPKVSCPFHSHNEFEIILSILVLFHGPELRR